MEDGSVMLECGEGKSYCKVMEGICKRGAGFRRGVFIF
jgi:hypothetical protein